MSHVTCFMPLNPKQGQAATAQEIQHSPEVAELYLITPENPPEAMQKYHRHITDTPFSSGVMRFMAQAAHTPYVLWVTNQKPLQLGQFAIERMVRVAQLTKAPVVYSDFQDLTDGKRSAHPVNDYQEGSLRDDFEFGSLVLIATEALKKAVAGMGQDYHAAGWYDLRLRLSQQGSFQHIPEPLYTVVHNTNQDVDEDHFTYVDPKNRGIQLEYEAAVTAHLKAVGGFVQPPFRTVDIQAGGFAHEASVVIPIKNRARTVRVAAESALKQQSGFAFNIIVVDNHSDDGTTDILQALSKEDPRVIHHIPERTDLGIGGCWNEGLHHPQCGRYALQLDSDDLYKNTGTIQKIVDKFHETGAAAVIGSYQLTDFDLNELPPGLIDHKEWTPENGPNNAMRINGFGAPRAFYTPLLREMKIPNVSYGEDYAAALALSREYLIERIYEPLYQCRRWEDNSDASMDIAKMNRANHYKDRIRSIELRARQNLVHKNSASTT